MKYNQPLFLFHCHACCVLSFIVEPNEDSGAESLVGGNVLLGVIPALLSCIIVLTCCDVWVSKSWERSLMLCRYRLRHCLAAPYLTSRSDPINGFRPQLHIRSSRDPLIWGPVRGGVTVFAEEERRTAADGLSTA